MLNFYRNFLSRVTCMAFLLLFSVESIWAELRLPAIFGSHMVLQRAGGIPVWGWANPGEIITVEFGDQSVEGVADDAGKWQLMLSELEVVRNGQAMIVSGSSGESLRFEDVLVGEVWICSGQSNMEWRVASADNAAEEAASANYPEIRYFDVKRELAYAPQEDLQGEWVVCSPETVRNFSAVGYFFGRHVHQAVDAPVGLIGTNWGGTVAEAWTSQEALLEKLPEFTEAIERMPETARKMVAVEAAFEKKWQAYQASFTKLYDLEADLEAAAQWADPSLDDAEWDTVPVPENWEKAGFKGLDGMVWLRSAWPKSLYRSQ